MQNKKCITVAVLLTSILLMDLALPISLPAWQVIENGLWVGQFSTPTHPQSKRTKIVVLKISPKSYDFKLLSASEKKIKSLSANEWAESFNLIAVINASMYQKDNFSSTGYMKNHAYYNNPSINAKFGAFMVFNPVAENVPSVRIIDRYHEDWKKLIKGYDTIIQNYRMISSQQKNMWKSERNPDRFTIACVGMDSSGNILFIHSQLPYSVQRFCDILLQLPLGIHNAMYVEGGSEASVFVKTAAFLGEYIGNYRKKFPVIPNVIGVCKKK